MVKKIDFSLALEIWKEQTLEEMKADEHPSDTELYEISLKLKEGLKDSSELMHIAKCKVCSQRLRDFLEYIEEAEACDLAFSKAADTKQEGPIVIQTRGGKYTISIRRSLSDENSGIITVEADSRYARKLEGRTILLKDHRKEVLLKGTIKCGEISQKVEKINDIDPSSLIVRSVKG